MWLIALAAAQPRIVNGQPAGGQFPEVVAITAEGVGGVCSGTRIHPEWVLTAAHCFDSFELATSEETFYITEGPDGWDEPDATVSQIVVHPTYMSSGYSPNAIGESALGMLDDLALLRLTEPLDGPVMRLNSTASSESWTGTELTIVGYGVQEAVDFTGPGVKRTGWATIAGFDDHGRIHTAPGADGTFASLGDSGGAGIRSDQHGSILVSVLSQRVADEQPPGRHIEISSYLDWIAETLAPFDHPITTADGSPPDFACNFAIESGGSAVGATPMELRCEAFAPTNVSSVTWSWGDGEPTTFQSTRASHTFDREGVYDIEACITQDLGDRSQVDCIRKPSHVTACDLPSPAFDVVSSDLTLTVEHQTSTIPACETQTTWDLFEGTDTTGIPLERVEAWEPVLTLTDAGTYTLVVHVEGVAGTGSASATVETRRSSGCSTTGVALPRGLSRRR